jgi:hypothetical protein
MAGAGLMFVVRRGKDGKIALQVTQHKHLYYEDYHSIFTMHKKEPHLKGEIVPKYSSEGKYIPQGG